MYIMQSAPGFEHYGYVAKAFQEDNMYAFFARSEEAKITRREAEDPTIAKDDVTKTKPDGTLNFFDEEIIQDLEETPDEEADASQLLTWHHRLNHLSFERIKALSMDGTLPKHLHKMRTPVCTACIYGKMT